MVMSGVKHIHFCEVEWRRQKTFHGFESKPALEKCKSTTPVVELRPFTQKEWSRESSLPGKNEPLNVSQSVESPKLSPTGPNISSCLPKAPPQVHVINLTDQILPRTNRIHPPVDTRPYIKQKHQHGFITLGDRTKSTLEDIRSGTCMTRSFSCLKQALTVDDIEKIQEIRLSGDKMRKDISKRRLPYLDPWGKYQTPKTPERIGQRPNLCHTGEIVPTFPNENEHPGRQTVYDSFDLAGSLPSLHINQESNRSAKPRRTPRGKSAGKKHGWKRIGRIKNSFQIMNEMGKPANIERQLTMELELNLENVRRHRDTGVVNSSTSSPRKFQQITYRSAPTTGEIHLQRGQSMNSRRSHRTDADTESRIKGHSRPTTEAKTECRDSGIQSPVESDDDSVDIDALQRLQKEKEADLTHPATGEAQPISSEETGVKNTEENRETASPETVHRSSPNETQGEMKQPSTPSPIPAELQLPESSQSSVI